MLHIDVNFLDEIARTCKHFPDRAVDLVQSIKGNQLRSKEILFEYLPNNSNVCVMGGWYGAPFLLANPTCKYDFVDLDGRCAAVGSYLWTGREARFITADALQYRYDEYDVVINCSTEHMDRAGLRSTLMNIPPRVLCLLQNSNQREVEDHINCFDSESHFVDWLSEFTLVNESTTVVMDNGSKRFSAICMTSP